MTKTITRARSSIEARRQAILSAAEALIREQGEVEFSMRALAERAEVSFATPFNHFGSKEGILRALLSARIDRELVHLRNRAAELTPLETIFYLAAHSADVYLEDADLYRPILRSVWSAGLSPNSNQTDSGQTGPDQTDNVLELWDFALQRLSRAGLFTDGADLEVLAKRLHFSFVVALLHWASGGLNDDELADHASDLVVGCLLRWLTPKGKTAMLKTSNAQRKKKP